MSLIVYLAVAFAAFRSGSQAWFRSLYTLTVAILLVSTLAAKFARRSQVALWFGFAVAGWCYLLLGFGLRPENGKNSYDDFDQEVAVNPFLASTMLIKTACIYYAN